MTENELFVAYKDLTEEERKGFDDLYRSVNGDINKITNLSYRISVAEQALRLNNIIGSEAFISVDWIMKNILKLNEFED